jgi:hypothetical protein
MGNAVVHFELNSKQPDPDGRTMGLWKSKEAA